MATWKDTKNLPEQYKVVADCIRVGKRNATLLSDIMIIAQITDRRQAYQIIENLINKYGFIVGASKKGEFKGYYYPANREEFEEIAATFKQSINSMEKRLNNLLTNYNKMGA